MTMYVGFYVVNLFKQTFYHKKNNIFSTVTLRNNLFCHSFSDHLQCTNRPFTYVLSKDILRLHSLADQNLQGLKKCYQRNVTQNQKRLEQQKGRLNVNDCTAEENLEEGLYLNQYSIIVSIQISTIICFCS